MATMKHVSMSGFSQDHHAKPTDAMRRLLQQPAAPYLEPKPPLGPRPLFAIANDIINHWPKPNYAAVPFIKAMRDLTTMNDNYGSEDARSLVTYFLSNAGSWRGEDARRIKAELNAMLK